VAHGAQVDACHGNEKALCNPIENFAGNAQASAQGRTQSIVENCKHQ
jgi:hypothetical protein